MCAISECKISWMEEYLCILVIAIKMVQVLDNDIIVEESHDPITKKRKPRTLTEEHKNNIRLAKLGVARSQDTKDKISAGHVGLPGPNLGKTFSQETKDKMRDARLGKKMHSKETVDKLRQNNLGDKNPNWKGGKSRRAKKDENND